MRRRLKIQHAATLLLVASLTVACGASADATETAFAAEILAQEGDGAGERFAVLTATWLRGQPGTVRRTEPLGVRGIFVSYAGLAREEVLHELGVPQILQLQPIDTCVDVHGSAGHPPEVGGEEQLWVDLLDAGEVGLEVAGRGHRLDCQYFPDVVAYVSGVTYAGTAELSRWAMRAAERPLLRFSGGGSGEVGPFSVERKMPAPLHLYAVGGRRARQGYVAVESEGDLNVRWDQRGATDEPVLLSLTRRSFGAVDAVRCVARDDGAFTIPGELRAHLPDHDEPATDRLTARRTTGAEFYARGIDEGWAFLVTEDFVLLRSP